MQEEILNASSLKPLNHVHHHEELGEGVESVLIAKTVTMLVLGLVSLSMGIIPMQVAKLFKLLPSHADHRHHNVVDPRSSKYVSVLLGFGGGVLLSTTFLHMMPEVEENVEHLVEKGSLPNFFGGVSLAKILTCAGFFIMYLIEEIVHSRLRHQEAEEEEEGNKGSFGASSKAGSNASIYNTESLESYGTVDWNQKSSKHQHHHHDHVAEIVEASQDGAIRGLLIVLGLSVHELFEGLAIGLERSAGYVWYMFGAVAAHKFIIAFCIGVELTSSRTKSFLSYLYVFMFAIVSPLGIGIGMCLVGGSAAASEPAAVVLQGLASGTLLYVVFFEILHKHRSGLVQYLSILLGFGLMFAIQIFTSHSHDHSNQHGGAVESTTNHDHEHHLVTAAAAAAIERVTEEVLDSLSTTLTS